MIEIREPVPLLEVQQRGRKSKFSVDFLIVGTQKGGTTALSTFLAQDPRICMAPGKEVHLFDAPDFQDDWPTQEINKRYQEAFPNFNGQELIGEATPIYMYMPNVARRIHAYNPHMKLIVLLRDPIPRAIAHYQMERKRSVERLPLTLALLAEPFRLWRARNDYSLESPRRSYSYVDRGRYTAQIARLREFFADGQIFIVCTEDLWENHEKVLISIYEFLGLDVPSQLPQRERIFAAESKSTVGWSERLWLWSCLAAERKFWGQCAWNTKDRKA